MRLIVIALFAVLFASPAIAGSDRFSVKDASKNKVFTVQDDGSIIAPGLKFDAQQKRLGLGTTNPQAVFHAADSSVNSGRGVMVSQHNDGPHGAAVVFRKSRGTEANPLQPIGDDYIGVLGAQFWNGSMYDRSAQLGFRNDGPVIPGEFPTAIMFYTGSKTSGAFGNNLKEAMRISSSQNVGVGISNPTQRVEVNGGVRLNAAVAQPPCDANARGTFWVVQGATDTVQVCIQTATGLAWKTITLQ